MGVEFRENLIEAGGVSEVITSSEYVAGVEADSDAGFVLDEGDYVSKVGECGADYIAGAGHCF